MPTGSRVGAHFLSSVLRMLEPRTDDDFGEFLDNNSDLLNQNFDLNENQNWKF